MSIFINRSIAETGTRSSVCFDDLTTLSLQDCQTNAKFFKLQMGMFDISSRTSIYVSYIKKRCNEGSVNGSSLDRRKDYM